MGTGVTAVFAAGGTQIFTVSIGILSRLPHDSTSTSDRADADQQRNNWRPLPRAAVLVLPLLAPPSGIKIRPELQPAGEPGPLALVRRRADLAGQ
eukprot:jgi/Tetstr1/423753/TSEL_014384.t1